MILRPRRAFDFVKQQRLIGLALLLLLFRFSVTVVNTVVAMYVNRSPMVLDPPFGLDPDSYRFYEIFWYGPYGLFIVIVITAVIVQICRRIYRRHDVRFSKSLEIVAFAFFTPWLLSVPGDWLLIATVNAAPAYLIPFHVALLAWECALVSIGFQRVYGIARDRGGMLGLAGGTLFLGLGGLLIR